MADEQKRNCKRKTMKVRKGGVTTKQPDKPKKETKESKEPASK